MDLITPGIGLMFWMLLSFTIVLLILKKFAWKPILGFLKAREDSIDEALRSAETARNDMARLKADNERVLAEARQERERMLREAREMQEKIISDAKKQASVEAAKLTDLARQAIQAEKLSVLEDLRMQVANLSIEIAEKILRDHLRADDKQQALVDKMIREIKLN